MTEVRAGTFLNGRVIVSRGDITSQDVDAIVNAANSSLLGGAGVDGAIHRAVGPSILEECRRLRESSHHDGLPPGKAVITTGGNLPARYVIHTVGPVYGHHGGLEAQILAQCYENSLGLAVQHNLDSVAFPAISTGAYGYPRDEAAAVSSEAIKRFLAVEHTLREVRLVFFLTEDAEVFLRHHSFPPI